MLSCVQYSCHNERKQSSIFPKLVGSRRRLKTEIPSNNNNVYIASPRKQAFFTKSEQQFQFLQRMKKARDIILSHQKHSKADINKKQQTSLIQNFHIQENRRGKLKCFSQVVYNIGSPTKRYQKQNSINHDMYNDRLLRECRSQFKPNQNQKLKIQRKQILFSNQKRKEKSERLRNMGERLMFQDKINSPLNFINTKKTNQVDQIQKLLMNIDLTQEIIDSNGSELMQKLINIKQKKQSKSEQKVKIEKDEVRNNNQEDENSQKFLKVIKFPFDSHKDASVKRIRLKLTKNNRRKKFPTKRIRENFEEGNKSEQNLDLYSQRQSDQSEKVQDQSVQQQNQNKNQAKNQKDKLNLNLSRYINSPHFKIDRWDPSGTIDFEAF